MRGTTRQPLVSVVMPVFNNAPYLAAAIESIRAQTYPHWELIVVDDGSSDDSVAIATAYAERDERVRPRCRDHGGVARALNDGIDAARGEWIARMDSDDVALPERLATQLDWVGRTGVDICGGQVETFGSEQRVWWFPQSHEAIGAELAFRAPLSHPLTMIRASVFDEYRYDPGSTFEDYELWTRLWAKYRMGNVPRVLLKYRRHARQTQALRAEAMRRDYRRFRFRYVYSRFPETPLDDYLALARIGDRQPAADVEDLRRAGEWLVALAALPDRDLRQRMALRWRETWARSPGLGPTGEQVFFYLQRRFERDPF